MHESTFSTIIHYLPLFTAQYLLTMVVTVETVVTVATVITVVTPLLFLSPIRIFQPNSNKFHIFQTTPPAGSC